MKKINFYVGILPEDENHFWSIIHNLNEADTDLKFEAVVLNKFDDPDGYLSFTVFGSWDAYKCFANDTLIKSLEHFEE
jgi:hypothetical protein